MTIYEIRIQSLLDWSWQTVFDVETFAHDAALGQTLLCSAMDQAQLQRILNRIHDMGLKIVAVQLVDSPENGRC